MIILFTIILTVICLHYIFKPFFNQPTTKFHIPDPDTLNWGGKEETKFPLAVRIVEPKVNADNISDFQTMKKFEFRPQTWEQFIGQKEAKEKAKTIIKKAHRGIRTHFLLDSLQGHGKTTYVELLAKSLKAKLISRIGKQVDEEEIINIINEINISTEQFIVLFIDEIDTIDWKVLKILNPIIESFRIVGKNIKPFIFAGATINKHNLIKTNPDTLDRISTHIKFARYNSNEIAQILTQYKLQMYPNDNITQKVIDIIAQNCKFNPRTAIALLEEYIVEQDINKILSNSKIIKNGLTQIDIKLLKILSNTKRPIGANALAMKAGLHEKEYLREFEPYLVEYEYINRVPSRIITNKGREIIKEV